MVCAVVLLAPEVHRAWRAGAIAHPVWPIGMPHVPISIALAKTAYAMVLLGCMGGLVGWRTRQSLSVASVGALYLLGVAQLTGNVVHNHHLVWFLAILAASPCGDAWSIDARDRGLHITEASTVYGIPIFFARACIAAIFFFPGLWKLREAGLDWIFSDNLRNQMWWKWAQYDWIPSFRIDRHPRVVRAMAGFAVAFELSFPFLLLVPRLRRYAAVLALFFHAGIEAVMRIPFSSLWLCYVVLIDWKPHAWARERPRVEHSVGAFVLAGVVLFGAMGWMNGWPFACYPTFQWRVGTQMPGLVVEDANGQTIVGRATTQDQWGVQWSLLGLRGGPFERERLLAAYPTGARFHRVWWSVDPDDRGKPPVRRELVATR